MGTLFNHQRVFITVYIEVTSVVKQRISHADNLCKVNNYSKCHGMSSPVALRYCYTVYAAIGFIVPEGTVLWYTDCYAPSLSVFVGSYSSSPLIYLPLSPIYIYCIFVPLCLIICSGLLCCHVILSTKHFLSTTSSPGNRYLRDPRSVSEISKDSLHSCMWSPQCI